MPRSAAGGLARESRSEREGRGVQVRKVGQRSHGRPFRTVRTTYWIDVQTACANGPPWPGTTWARQGVPRAYWTLLDAIRRNRTLDKRPEGQIRPGESEQSEATTEGVGSSIICRHSHTNSLLGPPPMTGNRKRVCARALALCARRLCVHVVCVRFGVLEWGPAMP